MRVLVPLGTRPEIVKLAPIIAALNDVGCITMVVATGQHYDPSLTDAFFADLGVSPDVRWTLSGTEAERLGQLVERATQTVSDLKPDLVLVLGDTHTVPSFCIAARRATVPVAH